MQFIEINLNAPTDISSVFIREQDIYGQNLKNYELLDFIILNINIQNQQIIN